MTPSISVILLVGNRRTRSQLALECLLQQASIKQTDLEVLIFECGNEHPPLPGSDSPQVRHFRRRQQEDNGAVRARGVEAAHAPIIAFIEDHVMVAPDWATSILAAFENSWAGVSSPPIAANRDVTIGLSLMWLSYGQWRGRNVSQEVDSLPGNNSAYRRDLLLAFEDDLAGLLDFDIVLQQALHAQGHRFYLDSAVRWAHINEHKMKIQAIGVYYISRLRSAIKAKQEGWHLPKQVYWCLTRPIMPLYRIYNMFIVARSNDKNRRHFFRGIIPIMTVLSVAAIGETIGILFGPGKASEKFLEFEVNTYRRYDPDRLREQIQDGSLWTL